MSVFGCCWFLLRWFVVVVVAVVVVVVVVVVGCWLLVVGCWLLVVGCCSFYVAAASPAPAVVLMSQFLFFLVIRNHSHALIEISGSVLVLSPRSLTSEKRSKPLADIP